MHYKKVQALLLAAALVFGSFFTGVSAPVYSTAVEVMAAELPASFSEDYEDGKTAGRGRGGSESVTVIEEGAKNGSKCLKVTNRSQSWHGVIWSIGKYTGTKIHISAWVKSDTAAQVKLTADEGNPWPNIATADTSSHDWVFIEGDYEVKSSVSNPQIYFETGKANEDIYVDDLQVEAVDTLREPPARGEQIVTNGSMEGELTDWTATGDASLAADTSVFAEGAGSALVSGRAEDNNGVSQDLSGYLKAGSTYEFSAKVKAKDAESAGTAVMSLETASASDTVASKELSGTDWTTVTGTYKIPENTNVKDVALGIIVSGNTGDFYVDDVSVIEVVGLSEDGVAKKIGMSNPLSDRFYGADPFAMEYNGRVYIYMTNDSQQWDAEAKDKNGFPQKSNGYGAISTIKVISSADMVNWTDHGEIPVAGPNGIAKWANNSWAPAAAHKTIDGKEKFFLYFANNGNGIGVLEADSPIGPFREPDIDRGGGRGKSHIIKAGDPQAQGVTWLFDPAVIVDSKGDGYLYYGGGIPNENSQESCNAPGTARVVKLKDNMVEVDGDAKAIDAPGLFEDSGIHEYNGKYYYTYCSNFKNNLSSTGNGNICLMVSDDPMEGFEFKQQILSNPSAFGMGGGNNHHAVFKFKDKWYITYHTQTLGLAIGYSNGYRTTQINELTYKEDGSINPVTMTYDGVAQLENINPYERIEAETIAWQSNITVADCDQPGAMVESENCKLTGIRNNSWVSIAKADFGEEGAKSLTANVASASGMTIEVHTGNVTNDPVATLTVAPTGGDDQFEEQTWSVSGLTGVQDVFLVFKGASAKDSMEMDYYKFSKEAASDTPSDTPSDEPSDTPSDKPSDTPSDKPSDTPSDKPSDTPSDKPSDKPSDTPSDKPSDKPSDTPSDKPSESSGYIAPAGSGSTSSANETPAASTGNTAATGTQGAKDTADQGKTNESLPVDNTVKVDTNEDGTKVETTTIPQAAEGASAEVVVQKDADGNVTGAKAEVSESVPQTSNKAKISKALVNNLVAAAGQDSVDVTLVVKGDDGKEKYRVEASTADLKSGKSLVMYKKKGNDFVMVDGKSIKPDKGGSITVTADEKATYQLVSETEAVGINKQIKNSAKLAKKTASIAKSKSVKISFAKTFDMENIKAISYASKKKSVASVSKNGTVKGKKAGATVIAVTVTFRNGEKKKLSYKVNVK